MLFRQLLLLSGAVQGAVALRLGGTALLARCKALRASNVPSAPAEGDANQIDIHLDTLSGEQFSVRMSLRASRRELEEAVRRHFSLGADQGVGLMLECPPFNSLQECGFPRSDPVTVVKYEFSEEQKAERAFLAEERRRRKEQLKYDILMAQHMNTAGIWGAF